VIGAALVVSAVAAALAGTTFTAADPIPGLPQPDTAVRLGLPVVRVLIDVAALVTVGLSLLPKLIGFERPDLSEPVLNGARRAAVATAFAWATCTLAALVLQVAELHPGSAPTPGQVVDYVLQVGAGKGLLLTAVCALVYAWVASLAVRHGEKVPVELRIGIAMFGMLPIPTTGHAVTGSWHDYTMLAMELHVLGSAAWTGGLAVMVALLSTRRTLLAMAIPRFSRLAAICLVTVGASGTLNSLVTISLTPGAELPGALLTTGYGQLAVLKLVLIVMLAGLGGHIRFRLMPLIAQHRRTALLGWATVEVAVMGLSFGLGVVLSRIPVLS